MVCPLQEFQFKKKNIENVSIHYRNCCWILNKRSASIRIASAAAAEHQSNDRSGIVLFHVVFREALALPHTLFCISRVRSGIHFGLWNRMSGVCCARIVEVKMSGEDSFCRDKVFPKMHKMNWTGELSRFKRWNTLWLQFVCAQPLGCVRECERRRHRSEGTRIFVNAREQASSELC